MPRSRRALLSAVAAAGLTTGCITGRGTSGPDPEPHRRVAVLDTASEGMSVDATVTSDQVTVDSTARLDLQFTNDTDAGITLGLTENPEPLVATPPGIVLFAAAAEKRRQRGSGVCWRPRGAVGGDGAMEQTNLQPGDSLTLSLRVWSHPDADGCLPTGEYDIGRGGSPSWRLTLVVRDSNDPE
jgi:hypothetical protein